MLDSSRHPCLMGLHVNFDLSKYACGQYLYFSNIARKICKLILKFEGGKKIHEQALCSKGTWTIGPLDIKSSQS